MGVQWGRIAMVISGIAFELHILTMLSSDGGYRLLHTGYDSEDDAVQAFLIIACLAFAVALVLLLLVNFSSLKRKLINIIALLCLFGAAFFVVVAVAVYGKTLDKIVGRRGTINPYSVTTYMLAAASGVLGGVFLLMEMCYGGD